MTSYGPQRTARSPPGPGPTCRGGGRISCQACCAAAPAEAACPSMTATTMAGRGYVARRYARAALARRANVFTSDRIERAVISGMREHLADPAAIVRYLERYNAERPRLAAAELCNR